MEKDFYQNKSLDACPRGYPQKDFYAYPGREKQGGKLIIEDNTIYEVDYDCLVCKQRNKLNRERK